MVFNKNFTKALLFIASFLTATSSSAQSLSYKAFIDSVVEKNQAYQAEKLRVPMSEAILKGSRSIGNPSLSVEYGNNSDWGIQMGQSLDIGLSQHITLGVVSARKNVARKELAIANNDLNGYLLELKADATKCYLDALMARDISELAHTSADNMLSLAHGDSIRHSKGDISELDMLQTRIEARMANQEYQASLIEYQNALITLDQLAGNINRGTTSITGSLEATERTYRIDELNKLAMENRSDLKGAQLSIDLAESQQQLTRRERLPEAELSLGISLNSRVRNEEAPAPEFIGYTAGLTLPLPFSNANKGNIKAAKLATRQAELQSNALQNQVEAEIIQALNRYQLAQKNAKTYSSQLVNDAETILQGKLYAYQRGETSLLEVLSAQQTYNEVMKNHIESLHKCLEALVDLQKSVGIIDINL